MKPAAYPIPQAARFFRLLPLVMILAMSACALHAPAPPPVHPVRPARPAASETQLRERARQSLQKATVSSNEYSACAMFSTTAHRGANATPDAIADAAATNCAAKLEDYESSMTSYYEINPIKPAASATPRERAHADRLMLEQKTREAVIQSLGRND